MNENWDGNSDDPGDEPLVKPEKRAKKPPAQVTLLVEDFRQGWLTARQKKRNLALPWSNKVGFQTRLLGLLDEPDMSSAVVVQMFKVFYRQVEVGHVQLKSDELWKDFWNNRAKILTLARQQMHSPTKVIDPVEEMRKFEEKMAANRKEQNR